MSEKLIFRKVINPIKTEYGNVFIKIKLEQKNSKVVLSIRGVEAPTKDGNCKGDCWQILDVLLKKNVEIKKDWDKNKINRLYQIWKDYHLNDMRSGTELQRKALKEKFGEIPAYDVACDYLKTIDLYEDKTQNHYCYGSAWLYEEIPQDAIDFLKSLPNTKITPAWV